MIDINAIPEIGGKLRKNILQLPTAVSQASGIIINGRKIRSFVFTTDLAIIRNCDANAVFAVYPFTSSNLSVMPLLKHPIFLYSVVLAEVPQKDFALYS